MKKEYIIIIFLLLGPFLDVSSFLGLPFSILLRGAFLIGSIAYLIIKNKDWKILIPLFIFGITIFGYQYWYLKFSIIASISAILKFLYLPVSMLFFNYYIFPVDKRKVFAVILYTYIGIYFFSYIFGIGADAYLETDGKSGFKGLFSSINEFSAILVSLLPIVTTYLKKKRRWIQLAFLITLSFICSLLIGTKVLMGGVLFSIFYLLWQEKNYLFCKRSQNQKIMIIISILIIGVVGCWLFTKTRTYQNMVIQQEFFEVENVFSFDFVNRVVYNDRLSFLKDNFNYFKNQDISKILLGIGIENDDVKMVEIDIFDILFRYGILGIILFIGITSQLIEWKKLEQEEKISMLLLAIISLTSGHVLLYPAVSIYFAVINCKSKNY